MGLASPGSECGSSAAARKDTILDSDAQGPKHHYIVIEIDPVAVQMTRGYIARYRRGPRENPASGASRSVHSGLTGDREMR